MRRLLGLFLLVAMIPALAVTAKDTGEYRDDFGSGGYSGSDGNLPWTGDWVESGESDGPNSGAVQIKDQSCSNNECLHIVGQGLIQLTRSISREADLSRFLDARLTYDLDIEPAPLISTGTFYVHVKGNGSGWHKLKSYELRTAGGSHTESFDVSPWRGPDFEVRFRLAGVLGGDDVAVDRVSISGQLASVTTTTSSTTSTSSTTTTSTTTPATITIPTIPGIGPSTITIPTIPGIGPPATTTPTSTTSTTAGTVQSTRPDQGQSPTDPGGSDQSAPSRSTTTTTFDSTTTTIAGAVPLGPPPGSSGGLRETAGGLMTDYRSGMMGDMGTGEIEVLGAEVTADFSMAVEVFEVAKVWIAILALGIAAAAISGVERRRARPDVVS